MHLFLVTAGKTISKTDNKGHIEFKAGRGLGLLTFKLNIRKDHSQFKNYAYSNNKNKLQINHFVDIL